MSWVFISASTSSFQEFLKLWYDRFEIRAWLPRLDLSILGSSLRVNGKPQHDRAIPLEIYPLVNKHSYWTCPFSSFALPSNNGDFPVRSVRVYQRVLIWGLYPPAIHFSTIQFFWIPKFPKNTEANIWNMTIYSCKFWFTRFCDFFLTTPVHSSLVQSAFLMAVWWLNPNVRQFRNHSRIPCLIVWLNLVKLNPNFR